MPTELTINGQAHRVDAPAATLLVELLRDHLGLTGTHIGCETSQCGVCNVLVDGLPVKACTVLAASLDGAAVITIEGLAVGEQLHPMQAAFREHHALQCGFCTPGMVIAGIGIAQRHGGDVSPQVIAHELEGNLCRCTGYINIVAAIGAGARAMHDA